MSPIQFLIRIGSCALIAHCFTGCAPATPDNKTATKLLIDDSMKLELQTDWRYNTNYSGVYTSPNSGEEYIFLGDPTTNLKVRVFNARGQFLDDILLDSANNALNNIHCLTMISNDSLLLFDDRGEKYIVIDDNGLIVRERNLTGLRCDSLNDLYELYPSNTGLTLVGEKLFLGPALLGACGDKSFYERTSSYLLNTQRYFALATGSCKLAELDPKASMGGVRFGLRGLLQHLTDTPRETIGMSYTTQANGKLFVFSEFSPFVNEIDTKSLTITHKIVLNFEFGDVGITPPPITESDLNLNGSAIRASTKAYIISFSYDQPTSQYLAAVVHEVPEDTPENERGWRRDWSLIVLDSAYNQVDEYILSGKEYSGSVLLSLKSGTWVLQKDLDLKGFLNPKIFRKLNL